MKVAHILLVVIKKDIDVQDSMSKINSSDMAIIVVSSITHLIEFYTLC